MLDRPREGCPSGSGFGTLCSCLKLAHLSSAPLSAPPDLPPRVYKDPSQTPLALSSPLPWTGKRPTNCRQELHVREKVTAPAEDWESGGGVRNGFRPAEPDAEEPDIIPEPQRGRPHLQTGPGSPLGQPQGFLRRLQSAEQVAEASENSHRERTLLPGPQSSKAILSGGPLGPLPPPPSRRARGRRAREAPRLSDQRMPSTAPNSACSRARAAKVGQGSLVPPHRRWVQGERLPGACCRPGCSAGPPRGSGAGAGPGLGLRKTPAERGAGLPPSESQHRPAPWSLPHRDKPGTPPQRRQTNFLQRRRCAVQGAGARAGDWGSDRAPQADEELKCWEVGGGWPTRTTGLRGLARGTHRPGVPLGAHRPGWGRRKGEGTAPQVAERRDQVARLYLQFLKFSLQLLPLALAALQLARHGAAARGGGGGGSRSVARRATSAPPPSARRPPSEAPAVPALPEPRAHLTSRPRPGARPTPSPGGRPRACAGARASPAPPPCAARPPRDVCSFAGLSLSHWTLGNASAPPESQFQSGLGSSFADCICRAYFI